MPAPRYLHPSTPVAWPAARSTSKASELTRHRPVVLRAVVQNGVRQSQKNASKSLASRCSVRREVDDEPADVGVFGLVVPKGKNLRSLIGSRCQARSNASLIAHRSIIAVSSRVWCRCQGKAPDHAGVGAKHPTKRRFRR